MNTGKSCPIPLMGGVYIYNANESQQVVRATFRYISVVTVIFHSPSGAMIDASMLLAWPYPSVHLLSCSYVAVGLPNKRSTHVPYISEKLAKLTIGVISKSIITNFLITITIRKLKQQKCMNKREYCN